MATTVDTLLVRIESDMSDIRRDLKRLETQTGQTTSKVKRSLNGMGTAFKAVLGGVLVAQLARGTIALTKFASDMEEMSAMSEAVFGQFVHSVRAELDAFGTAVGRSRFELEGMAASVQDTFVPMGFARDEAAKFSVNLTKLAVDVASFKNVSEKMTMDSFTSALVGNHETVRKFGVVITEAELKAELFRMGITKNSKDVDAATKVQARYNLIVAGTKDAQGDALKTSGSYANQTRALDAQFKLLAADLGNELLPMMKDLVATAIDGTKEFRRFLVAVGVGGTAMQKLVRATQDRMKAEAALNKQVRINQNMQIIGDAANRKTRNLLQELADAQKAQDIAAKAFAKTKGIGVEVAKKENEAQKKVNTTISDAQKFITGLQQESEILFLTRGRNSELAVLQKEAEHSLGKEYKENKALIDKLIEVNFKMAEAQEAAAAKTAKIVELNREAAAAQTKIKDTTKSLSEEYALLDAELQGATEAELAFMRVQQEHVGLSDKQKAELQALIAKNMAYKRVLDGTNKVNEEAVSIVDSMKTPTDELNEKLQILEAAYLNGAIGADKFKEAQGMIKNQMMELNPQFQSMKRAAETAADGISNALADAFVNGKFSMESLGDIFKQVIKQMIADAIKAQIIKFLMSAVTGFFAGGGSVAPTNMGNTTLSHAGGGSISRYGRAGGGMAMPTLVGERGPELFVPHTAGVVRNNHDTKNMMGGGPPVIVNQNINIETGVAQTVRAEVMSMMPRIKSETIQAMVDGKRRGNSISKVFA